jgi:hypothetical protein
MRRSSDETDFGRVTAIDVWIRHAAEHREVFAVLLKVLQVWRRLVVFLAPLGEETARNQAEIVIDRKKPARLGTWCQG